MFEKIAMTGIEFSLQRSVNVTLDLESTDKNNSRELMVRGNSHSKNNNKVSKCLPVFRQYSSNIKH